MRLPDFSRSWDHENDFYLSCDPTRISKLLAHYELARSVAGLPGAIVECGVFKGTSLARFAIFRELFGTAYSRQIIGFDAFGAFPQTSFDADIGQREEFVEMAGDSGTDIYEPAVTILEHLYPRIVRGGVLLLDDYGTWPGETEAVDEYFAGQDVTIEKLEFATTPCFVRKT